LFALSECETNEAPRPPLIGCSGRSRRWLRRWTYRLRRRRDDGHGDDDRHRDTHADERLFTAATPETHDYVAEAVSANFRDSADVTSVVRYPTTYGILVQVDGDGLTVHDYHGDPGPAYNPNCY
jgi:hypothetical protein